MDQNHLTLLMMSARGVGERTVDAVLRRNAVAFRDADGFLALTLEQLVQEYGIGRAQAQRLRAYSSGDLDAAEADARWLRRNGVALITVLDASYPNRLLNRMEVPPPVLFSYGNAGVLDLPLIAVANSNRAPEPALACCDRGTEIALLGGWALVTGHNRIPYQRPALVTRRNGGRICYVLDRGMAQGFGGDLSRALFPAARIWGPAYDPACDVTLSPFAPRAHGVAANNRRRDSLVYSLADVILAGEVRVGGQMERECLAALERGTPVYLMPEGSRPVSLRDAGAREISISELPHVLPALNRG